MATKNELEQKSLFRFTKVIFWFSSLVVVGLTIIIWYTIASQGLDASQAYFVCNGGSTEHQLTPSQQSYIETYHVDNFKDDLSATDKETANTICYQEYSGKDPNSATQADIQNFRAFQAGSNGAVYMVQGVQRNWYWGYLLVALIIEYLVFHLIRTMGLYVAGGKEALEP